MLPAERHLLADWCKNSGFYQLMFSKSLYAYKLVLGKAGAGAFIDFAHYIPQLKSKQKTSPAIHWGGLWFFKALYVLCVSVYTIQVFKGLF